jgi:hypothetical protein
MGSTMVVLLTTSWSDVLAVVNGAGLIAAVGVVTIAGLAVLLFRRW